METSKFVILEVGSAISSSFVEANPEDVIILSSAQELLEHPSDESGVRAIVAEFEVIEGQDEIDTVRLIKQKYPFSALILASADPGKIEMRMADILANGADDFVEIPLQQKDVKLRVGIRAQAIKTRLESDEVDIGDIRINRIMRTIEKDGERRSLSPTEINLIYCLAVAKGSVVEREVIKKRCWGQEHVSDNALNRKLHEVRRALKDLSQNVQIKTIYGTGFMLEVDRKSDFAPSTIGQQHGLEKIS